MAAAPQDQGPTTRGDFENVLDMVTDRLDKLSAENQTNFDAWKSELSKQYGGASPHMKQLTEKLDAVGGTIKTLQEEQQRLKRIIADKQLEGRQGDREASGVSTRAALEYRAVGTRVTESDAYKEWVESKGRSHQTTPGILTLGSLWPEQRAMQMLHAMQLAHALEKRSTVHDSSLVGDFVTPQYIPGIITLPKRMPVLRPRVRVITATSDLMYLDRETEENLFTTKLTADISATDTTAALEELLAIEVEAPFNELIFTDGTNTETKLVSAINGNVVTVPAFTNAFSAANTRVLARNISTTAEGVLAPLATDLGEDYKVPIADLAISKRVTLQKLADIPGFQDWMVNRALRALARMSDLNHFYGKGDGAKGIRGIWTDPAVQAFGPWSSQPADTTTIDYVIRSVYAMAVEDYMADTAIVPPLVHQDMTLEKGADKHYVYWINNQPGMPSQLMTLDLVMSSQLRGNDALVGELSAALVIGDRQQATVDIGTENDDLRKRRRTVVINQREGLGIELPGALRKLNFDSKP